MLPATVKSLRDLGVALRDARRARGWTQGQLAERMGLSQATVSAAERGTRDLHLNTLLALLATLDLELVLQPKTVADLGSVWQ